MFFVIPGGFNNHLCHRGSLRMPPPRGYRPTHNPFMEQFLQSLEDVFEEEMARQKRKTESRKIPRNCQRGPLMRNYLEEYCRNMKKCPARHWKEACGNPGENTKWVYRVNCSGFSPADMKVKIADGSVHVHARREESEGYQELMRTIVLPADVDKTKVVCRLLQGGDLVLEAQLSKPTTPGEESMTTESAVKRGTSEERKQTEKKDGDEQEERKREEGQKEKCGEGQGSGEETSREQTNMEDFLQEGFRQLGNIMAGIVGPFSADFELDTAAETPVPEKRESAREDDHEETCLMVCETPSENTQVSVPEKRESDSVRKDHEETCLMVRLCETPSENTVKEEEFVDIEKEVAETKANQKGLENTRVEFEGERFNAFKKDDREANDRAVLMDENLEMAEQVEPETEEAKEHFEVKFRLKNFKPEDIRVTLGDNTITLRTECQVNGDTFRGARNFSRHIDLPEAVDASALICRMSSEVLTISAPFRENLEGKEKEIIVQMAD